MDERGDRSDVEVRGDCDDGPASGEEGMIKPSVPFDMVRVPTTIAQTRRREDRGRGEGGSRKALRRKTGGVQKTMMN